MTMGTRLLPAPFMVTLTLPSASGLAAPSRFRAPPPRSTRPPYCDRFASERVKDSLMRIRLPNARYLFDRGRAARRKAESPIEGEGLGKRRTGDQVPDRSD